jgi:hypothetical protein
MYTNKKKTVQEVNNNIQKEMQRKEAEMQQQLAEKAV